MFNTLGKPIKGVIFFDNGSKMTMNNIISASVEVDNTMGFNIMNQLNILVEKNVLNVNKDMI